MFWEHTISSMTGVCNMDGVPEWDQVILNVFVFLGGVPSPFGALTVDKIMGPFLAFVFGRGSGLGPKAVGLPPPHSQLSLFLCFSLLLSRTT